VIRVLWLLACVLALFGVGAVAVDDWPDAISLVADFAWLLLAVGAATTGALVVTRVRGNAVGWLLLALGLGIGATIAFAEYAQVSRTTSLGPLPGAQWVAWFGDWPGVPFLYGVPAFLLLLFPDGHLPSPRWRPAAWFTGIAVAAGTAAHAVLPGDVQGFDNPVAPSGAAGDLARTIADLTDLLALPVMLVAASALVVRFRRSRGIERLQLKSFTYAAAMAGLGLGLTTVTSGFVSGAAFVIGLFALAALPVTAGLAILRYRLYDIDLVIRRTLIYAALTVTLGATYFGLVLLVGLAVGHSGFAVAVSTLAVAALFRPALTRIQATVDRRFYRRRYDAARTLEAFGGRLRDEVDLEALTADLRGVVAETVQPAHVSVWLR
jgi:hypothetical protein